MGAEVQGANSLSRARTEEEKPKTSKRKRDFRFCKRKDILSVTEYGFLKVREGFLAFFSQG